MERKGRCCQKTSAPRCKQEGDQPPQHHNLHHRPSEWPMWSRQMCQRRVNYRAEIKNKPCGLILVCLVIVWCSEAFFQHAQWNSLRVIACLAKTIMIWPRIYYKNKMIRKKIHHNTEYNTSIKPQLSKAWSSQWRYKLLTGVLNCPRSWTCKSLLRLTATWEHIHTLH